MRFLRGYEQYDDDLNFGKKDEKLFDHKNVYEKYNFIPIKEQSYINCIKGWTMIKMMESNSRRALNSISYSLHLRYIKFFRSRSESTTATFLCVYLFALSLVLHHKVRSKNGFFIEKIKHQEN